eukprot:767626-Hanusia_phi.AAC.1
MKTSRCLMLVKMKVDLKLHLLAISVVTSPQANEPLGRWENLQGPSRLTKGKMLLRRLRARRYPNL